jgi:hypothetical protein
MSGHDYDVDVAGFRRYIDPQTPDLFRLRVTTPRSSIHTGVTVRLRYSDGHVQSSKPLALRIFQPRNAPQN